MPANHLNAYHNSPSQRVESAALASLDARRSVPFMQLSEPGPDQKTLLRLLDSATRVPDHGARVPFRFISIRGDARRSFGEQLAARHIVSDPQTSDAALAKDRDRYLHAPVIVVLVAQLGPDEKIPSQERLLTAGCTGFALLQAAQATGFGGCWLTGWAAYDRGVADVLGLEETEHVIGFIHLGTPTRESRERKRPDPAELLTQWTP